MSTVTLSQRELKRRRKLGAEYVAPSPYTLKAALEKGDIFTKLSILVFGLGNIVHKQYVKGLLFLASEVGFILFMIFSGAHDDLTLWDKLSMSMFGADNAVNLQALYEAEPGEQTERVLEANKLAAGIIYTAAGLPFMLSGEEYGKTKHGNDNSFDSGKEVNQIDWVRAARMGDLLDFYRTLIALRRANPDWFSAEHIAVEAPGDTVAYRVHDTAVLINPGHDDAALDARALEQAYADDAHDDLPAAPAGTQSAQPPAWTCVLDSTSADPARPTLAAVRPDGVFPMPARALTIWKCTPNTGA